MPLALAGVASSILGGAKLFRRLKPPSEKRAAPLAQQLVASANNGNATAAAAIFYRQSIGIEKERAVWRSAFAQLSPDMQRVGRDFSRQLLPLVDHSTPETAARSALANFKDVAELATPTRAVAPKKPKAAPAPGRTTSGTSRARRPRAVPEEVEPEIAEAYQGRQQRAYERATGERWATRYDPQTREKWRVPESAPEFDEWPARKPRAAARRRAGARRPTARQASRTAREVIELARDPAVRALALTGAGLAAAGIAAYLVTTKILDDDAEGVTIENAVARYRSMAATEFQKRTGRRPTREEYAELRAMVAREVGDQVAAMSGSIPARWRNFMRLFKGA